jgi:hypothetical protein
MYAEFLGVDEYNRAKKNYEKTLQTMESLYRAEIERLDFTEMPNTTQYQNKAALLSAE